jgi:hypothetical protein
LWVALVVGRRQAALIADVFAIEPEYQQKFAHMWGTVEWASVGTGKLPDRFAPPTLSNGEDYFDTLFRSDPGMQTLLRHFDATSFSELVLAQHTIPSELFPKFPLTNEEVVCVDFENICPTYPSPEELDELIQHAPEANQELIERLRALDLAAHDLEVSSHRDQVEESEQPDHIHVSLDDRAIFECNYTITSLTSHTDGNCYLSGTDSCSAAHILVHARVSPSVQMEKSAEEGVASVKKQSLLSGKFVQEGLPCCLNESTGVREGIDWVRAADPIERGAGTSHKLYKDWRDRRRWLVAMPMNRIGGKPGNNLHFALMIDNAAPKDEKKEADCRVRGVDYLTTSFGGVAVMLGKYNPRAFEGLEKLKKVGVLPPLTETQAAWSASIGMFDVEDVEHRRVLTALFYSVVVERYVEQVSMWRKGLCSVRTAPANTG